jgi:hypothetical protein
VLCGHLNEDVRSLERNLGKQIVMFFMLIITLQFGFSLSPLSCSLACDRFELAPKVIHNQLRNSKLEELFSCTPIGIILVLTLTRGWCFVFKFVNFRFRLFTPSTFSDVEPPEPSVYPILLHVHHWHGGHLGSYGFLPHLRHHRHLLRHAAAQWKNGG